MSKNKSSVVKESEPVVSCPYCQRGDIWQEAVNRTEYVYRGQPVSDGQEVIDYFLAEVRSLLEIGSCIKKRGVFLPSLDRLDRDIREILILGLFHIIHGEGKTAEEISNLKKRAEQFYLSNIKFRGLVNKLTFAIVDLANKYKNDWLNYCRAG